MKLFKIDNNNISKRKDKFLSFYFFMMYLYTSMPSLQFNMTENMNLFFLLFGYGLTAIAVIKYKVNFANAWLIFIALIIVIWSVLQKLIHPSYFTFSPFIALEVFAAYVIVNIYKETLFKHFEDTTYILSSIALIFWILDLVAHPLLVSLSNAVGVDATAGLRANSLYVYTVYLTDTIRNSAFGWEPGRAACMICVGILFNLMRTNFNLKTKRFWVMVACLISTLSTTGFVTFIVLFILCYISMRKVNPVVFVMLIISVIGISSLPFMYEKVIQLSEQGSDKGMTSITESLRWEKDNNFDSDRGYYVPQRFQGLMFSYFNLANSNYVIGEGRDFTKFYVNRKMGLKVKTSEGILEFSVSYGLILGFISYFLLYRASSGISKLYNVRNKWLFFIVFVMISISYNFWEVPLFMAIWMMPIFIKLNYASKKSTIPIYCHSLLQQP